ncbi:MAG: tRNA1(Val) (adenine(37)-N6)-methyltransferase [Clostridia bacterium]|nr:tRNA1(Val) (adenine(37)-N6)-methyltransferase [Clostridia bacterium]
MAIRTDDTGFGLLLLQDPDAFCYGVDAVLLADYCRADAKDRLLDLGAGNGAASFIAYGKYKPAKVLGIELQRSAADLANESARLNRVETCVSFLCGDVKAIRNMVDRNSFSVVLCNPPYFEAGRGPVPPSDTALSARYETTATLEDFIRAAAYALEPAGRFVLVHRPSRLPDIFESCRRNGLEPKRMRFVQPKPGASPNIVLACAVKGGGKELQVDPPLCVRGADGRYTDELQAIYGRK